MSGIMDNIAGYFGIFFQKLTLLFGKLRGNLHLQSDKKVPHLAVLGVDQAFSPEPFQRSGLGPGIHLQLDTGSKGRNFNLVAKDCLDKRQVFLDNQIIPLTGKDIVGTDNDVQKQISGRAVMATGMPLSTDTDPHSGLNARRNRTGNGPLNRLSTSPRTHRTRIRDQAPLAITGCTGPLYGKKSLLDTDITGAPACRTNLDSLSRLGTCPLTGSARLPSGHLDGDLPPKGSFLKGQLDLTENMLSLLGLGTARLSRSEKLRKDIRKNISEMSTSFRWSGTSSSRRTGSG